MARRKVLTLTLYYDKTLEEVPGYAATLTLDFGDSISKRLLGEGCARRIKYLIHKKVRRGLVSLRPFLASRTVGFVARPAPHHTPVRDLYVVSDYHTGLVPEVDPQDLPNIAELVGHYHIIDGEDAVDVVYPTATQPDCGRCLYCGERYTIEDWQGPFVRGLKYRHGYCPKCAALKEVRES